MNHLVIEMCINCHLKIDIDECDEQCLFGESVVLKGMHFLVT